jgi:hypothetical protein
MKQMLLFLLLVCQSRILIGQGAKECPGLHFKFLKERVLLDDTAYLHINLKLFNEGAEDTSIVYLKNWNFCFYSANSFIEGRNYFEKDHKLDFLSKAGQEGAAENLILVCSNYMMKYAEGNYYLGPHCLEGDCNSFCAVSDTRKLCGKDTLEVDFWLSDPRFVNTSTARDLVHPYLFIIDPQLSKDPKGEPLPYEVRKQIPLLSPKDLHIVIKNPPPVIKKGHYHGHFYEHSTSPSNCERKYLDCRTKPCLR